MPNYNLLDNSLNDLHERLGQSAATTPAIGSIIPLDEFAIAATNLFPFLAHNVTSQVENASAHSKRLSCTLVSLAVGQMPAFFRFLVGGLGSSRRIPKGAGADGAGA
ncbi:MAG: hypothetical protein ACYCSN_06865, partial [Acidobacteriaceae bacterium]